MELNVDEVRLRPIRLPVGFGIVVPAHAPATGAPVRGTQRRTRVSACDARSLAPQLLHSVARLGCAQGPHGISADFALVLVLNFVWLAPIQHNFARHLGHPGRRQVSCDSSRDALKRANVLPMHEKFLGSFHDFLLFVKKRNRHGFVTLISQVRSPSSQMAEGESAGVGMTTAPAGWAARRRRKRLNSGAESAREGLQPSKGRRLRPLSSSAVSATQPSKRRRLSAKSARKRLKRAPWRAPNSPLAPYSILNTQYRRQRVRAQSAQLSIFSQAKGE